MKRGLKATVNVFFTFSMNLCLDEKRIESELSVRHETLTQTVSMKRGLKVRSDTVYWVRLAVGLDEKRIERPHTSQYVPYAPPLVSMKRGLKEGFLEQERKENVRSR